MRWRSPPAWWQSGYAADCKSAYAGSIPTQASIARCIRRRDPGWEVVVQKTGFLTEAGKCLALQARIQGRDVVIVLLNSWGKYTRVADARRIRKWMESRAGG